MDGAFLVLEEVGAAAAAVGVRAMGVLFILGALSKLLHPEPFVAALRGYQLLPPKLLLAVSVGLPPTELVIGVELIIHRESLIVASFSALLLLLFAAAMTANLLRGRGKTPCGCGLLGGGVVSWHLVIRNLALAGISYAGTPPALPIVGTTLLLSLASAAIMARLSPSSADSKPQFAQKTG